MAKVELKKPIVDEIAAKVGREYGKTGFPKILIVGKESKNHRAEVGTTTPSIHPEKGGADNDHYRKTLYTLALLLAESIPKSFSKEDLEEYEELLQKFCLTNYFKCAVSGGEKSCYRGLPHTKAMKSNCYHLLEKEIDVLEPDIVIIQGKFTPKEFWSVYENGERVAGNKTKEDDTISAYRHKNKKGKEFYILYSYHPGCFRAWGGELLNDLKSIIASIPCKKG